MYKVKLFSTSLQNDDFVAFMRKNTRLKGEEDDELLEYYMNHWLSKNKGITLVQTPHPLWVENHLICMLFYEE